MTEIVKQKRLSPGVFLLLIILLSCFAPISTDMYLPALSTMVEELNTTESVMNITLYGFMLMLAISMLVTGPIIDKYGRKKFLIGFLVLYIIVTFAAAFAKSIEVLIILRLLQAFGSGGVMTISTAFVKDAYYGTAMTRALNIVAMIGVLGPVIAPVAGAALISTWGWRETFIAPALFGVICLIISLFVTETLPEDQRVTGGMSAMLSGMKGLFRDRAFMSFLIIICLFNLPLMAYLAVSSYVYEDTFGFSETEYSLVLACALIFSIIMMSVINKVTCHTVNKKLIPLFFVIGLIGSVLMYAVGHDSWVTFLVAYLFLVTAGATIRPWGMSVLMRSYPGNSGTVSSMINFMFFMMATIGMVLATVDSDFIMVLGVLSLAVCVLYVIMYLALAKIGFSKIRQLEGTAAGDDLQ